MLTTSFLSSSERSPSWAAQGRCSLLALGTCPARGSWFGNKSTRANTTPLGASRSPLRVFSCVLSPVTVNIAL